MPDWLRETIANCLDRVGGTGGPSVQASAYKVSGLYPIVDQGKGLIAGWTDDATGLISRNLPVVVFGDHTRAFKYVDFPFVRGADGTQLLKPKEGIDPLFFYYACQTVDLPTRGYNRHFRALKEQEIPIPPFEEQLGIGQRLRLLEKAIALQLDEVRSSEILKRMAMRALFTLGVRGEPQKETEIGLVPESWEVVRLGSLGRVGNGSTPKKSVRAYWDGGTFPWLTSAKVYNREITAAEQFVTERALRECHLPVIEPGAILIAITGQGKTLGHCAVLRTQATVNQHLAYVAIDSQRADPSFIRGYIETQYGYLRQVGAGGGSTKGALTCAFLREMPIPLPITLAEQEEIVHILEAVNRKIDLHRRKRAVLDDLFKAFLSKLMTGKIRVTDLDLSAPKPNGAEPAVA